MTRDTLVIVHVAGPVEVVIGEKVQRCLRCDDTLRFRDGFFDVGARVGVSDVSVREVKVMQGRMERCEP